MNARPDPLGSPVQFLWVFNIPQPFKQFRWSVTR